MISTATAFRPGHYGDHSLNGTLVSARCPLSLSAINTAVGRNNTLRETKLRRHHVRLSEKLQFRGIPCDASRAILQRCCRASFSVSESHSRCRMDVGYGIAVRLARARTFVSLKRVSASGFSGGSAAVCSKLSSTA